MHPITRTAVVIALGLGLAVLLAATIGVPEQLCACLPL
jgi:hypothetical protein